MIFDDDNSYILHKKTKKIIKMRKERGVSVVDVYMAKDSNQGFKRQR